MRDLLSLGGCNVRAHRHASLEGPPATFADELAVLPERVTAGCTGKAGSQWARLKAGGLHKGFGQTLRLAFDPRSFVSCVLLGLRLAELVATVAVGRQVDRVALGRGRTLRLRDRA